MFIYYCNKWKFSNKNVCIYLGSENCPAKGGSGWGGGGGALKFTADLVCLY